MSLFGRKTEMVTPDRALPGSEQPRFGVPETNEVLGTPQTAPAPEGMAEIWLAMGCFWGSEELYWQLPGVYTTAVGYAGGYTPNPTYEETCTARTGHTESVRVVYDPTKVSTAEILKVFWENHDPTQDNRQGNDVGSQYRSAIYWTTDEQRAEVEHSAEVYAKALADAGVSEPIRTEIAPAADTHFWYAEGYHQQYLHKNPYGYRCHSKTGVEYPAA